jgi:hypothetical protein
MEIIVIKRSWTICAFGVPRWLQVVVPLAAVEAPWVMLSSSLVMFTMKIAINRNIPHLKKHTQKKRNNTKKHIYIIDR